MNKQNQVADAEDKPKELTVTPITEIERQSEARLVEISGFYGEDGESIVVRLRHASLLEMARAGSIPNELLSTVSELYKKGLNAELDLKRRGEALQQVAKAVLVEPTYEQLTEKGIALTDRQLSEIYIFMMNGVRALKTFRGAA